MLEKINNKGRCIKRIKTSNMNENKAYEFIGTVVTLSLLLVLIILGVLILIHNYKSIFVYLDLFVAFIYGLMVFDYLFGENIQYISIYTNGIWEELQYIRLSRLIVGKKSRFIPWKDVMGIYPNTENISKSIIKTNDGGDIVVKREFITSILEELERQRIKIKIHTDVNYINGSEKKISDTLEIQSLSRFSDNNQNNKLIFLGNETELRVDRNQIILDYVKKGLLAFSILAVPFILLSVFMSIPMSTSLLILTPAFITIGLFETLFIMKIASRVRITRSSIVLHFLKEKKEIPWDNVNLMKTLNTKENRNIYSLVGPTHGEVSVAIIDYFKENRDKFVRE